MRIVREKYLNQAKTSDKEKLQNFLSELYVFLSDQMHAGLNKVTSWIIFNITHWNVIYLSVFKLN